MTKQFVVCDKAEEFGCDQWDCDCSYPHIYTSLCEKVNSCPYEAKGGGKCVPVTIVKSDVVADLLTALEALVARCKHPYKYPSFIEETPEVQAACAAIAKARGEQ